MPALIRAGAVGPPVKQAKSGGAGLCARRLWWHRLPACAPHRQDAGATKFSITFQIATCRQSLTGAFGPPINYEKFLMGHRP